MFIFIFIICIHPFYVLTKVLKSYVPALLSIHLHTYYIYNITLWVSSSFNYKESDKGIIQMFSSIYLHVAPKLFISNMSIYLSTWSMSAPSSNQTTGNAGIDLIFSRNITSDFPVGTMGMLTLKKQGGPKKIYYVI